MHSNSLVTIAAALFAVAPWFARASTPVGRRLAAKPREARESGPAISTPVIMELLAAALSVGVSVPRALAATGNAIGGSTGLNLTRAGRRLEFGATWRDAWAGAPPNFGILADALRPAWEEGAAATEALRAASEAARRARQDAARITAGRLGVKLVLPLGLCLLPAFVLIGLIPMMLSLGLNLITTP